MTKSTMSVFGKISRISGLLTACAAFTAIAAIAQTKPTFDVATVKPSAPLDMAKMAADFQAGRKPNIGAHVDAGRAEYKYMSLRDLIVYAYGVKPYQVSGPDWLPTLRYDITAKMPEGAQKEEASKMLQTLLEERFSLALHRSKAEHPVLGLVVAKGGPTLKESPETPKAIDASTPLKQGEMESDGPEGKVRMTIGKDGNATVNMGAKGIMSYKTDRATQTIHMEGSMITMSGFADMLTQFSQAGGSGGRQVVDMTGLKGIYQIAIQFSLSDLMQMAKAAGLNVGPGAPGAPATANAGPADAASDPNGTASSVTAAVRALGLKLEPRRAVIEQLIVDHAEKTPKEN